MANLDGYDPHPVDPAALRLEDRWILSRMTACLSDLNDALRRYRFSEAMKVLYRFMWDEFCSAYIEMTKPRLSGGEDRASAQQLLVFVLDQLLRMLHPFTPFVTEAIWEKLNSAVPERGLREITHAEPALVAAAWPRVDGALRDERTESDMAGLQTVIKAVREIRTVVNDYRSRSKQPSMRTLPKAAIRAEAETCRLVEHHRAFLTALAGCDSLTARQDMPKPQGAMSRVEGHIQVYVPVSDLVDLTAVRKTEESKLAELRSAKERAERQLGDENFVRRANPAVVSQTRGRVEALSSQIHTIEQHLAEME